MTGLGRFTKVSVEFTVFVHVLLVFVTRVLQSLIGVSDVVCFGQSAPRGTPSWSLPRSSLLSGLANVDGRDDTLREEGLVGR